ncbi:MAG: response regulator [Magnetococcales bacterium]|nr:response regulator [Magnetococcales bacterium]
MATNYRHNSWSRLLTTFLASAFIPLGIALISTQFFNQHKWVHEPFHALLEGMGSIVALLVSLFIIIMRNNRQLHPKYIWVAAALLSMGLLDGFHAATRPGNTFVWLHSLATFLGGVTFTMIFLPENISSNHISRRFPYIIAIISVAIGLISVISTYLVPVMIQNQSFTTLATSLNIIGGVGFIFAWFHFAWGTNTEAMQGEQILLANHCLLFGVAGILFEFSILWDNNWWLWHIIRLAAYLILLFFFLKLFHLNIMRLRESEDRFRNLVEASSDWIWELDCDANFIYASPGVKTILGYKPEELIGNMSWFDLMPLNEAYDMRAKFNLLVSSAKPFDNIINDLIHKDGHRLIMESSGRPFFDKNGSVAGFRGIDRDITERKQLEETLRQAKNQADAANSSKSQFLAIMSHEIRTPLNAIFGTIELMKRMDLSSKVKEHVDTVHFTNQKLLGIIGDILDFSKVEEGKLELQFSNFSLHELLERLSALMRPKALEKGLELTLSTPVGLQGMLHGDAVRLQQILWNLVSNAIKFTQSGKVSITTKVIQSCESTATLSFSVADTGIGIHKDKISVLFDPFVQIDTSKSRHHQGSGLGLAICRQLVQLMGGTISVESEQGRGSCFRFVLQFETVSAHCMSEHQMEIATPKQWSLLLVEDEEVNRNVVAKLLNSEGYMVIAAPGGKEAINLLATNHFDLVLMDLHMPEMDGLATTREMRRIQQFNNNQLKIVAFTGDVLDSVEKECREAGMDGIISKPIQIEKFNKTIASIMGANPKKNSFHAEVNRSVSNTHDSPLLDHTYLDMLKTRLGPEKLSELVKNFFTAGQLMLEELEQYYIDNDMDGMRETSHRMKGMVKHLGMERLGEITGDFQHQTMHEHTENLKPLLEKIQATFYKSSESLDQFVASFSQP